MAEILWVVEWGGPVRGQLELARVFWEFKVGVDVVGVGGLTRGEGEVTTWLRTWSSPSIKSLTSVLAGIPPLTLFLFSPLGFLDCYRYSAPDTLFRWQCILFTGSITFLNPRTSNKVQNGLKTLQKSEKNFVYWTKLFFYIQKVFDWLDYIFWLNLMNT